MHRLGRLSEAQAIYEEILGVEPRHFDALHLLGLIAARTGNPGRAAALLGKAVEIDPAMRVCSSIAAMRCASWGTWEAALACYDQVIALKSDHADAHYNRGSVLAKLEQPAAALASFDRAIEINPKFAAAHFNRGNLLQELGQWDSALASYEQAIEADP